MNSENSEKKHMYDSQVDIAKKLLKEKYNEEFEVTEIGQRYGTLNNDTFTAICYPKNNKTVFFNAEISKEGEFLEDNYLSRIVCEELTTKVSYALNKSSVTASVLIVSRPDLIEGTNASVDANDIINSSKEIDFVVYIVKGSSASDEEALDAVKSIKSEYIKFGGECRIYTSENNDDIAHFAELVSEDKTFTSDMRTLLADCKEIDYQF